VGNIFDRLEAEAASKGVIESSISFFINARIWIDFIGRLSASLLPLERAAAQILRVFTPTNNLCGVMPNQDHF